MSVERHDEDNVWVEGRINMAGLTREEVALAGAGLARQSVLDLLVHLMESGVSVMELRQLYDIIAGAEIEMDQPND